MSAIVDRRAARLARRLRPAGFDELGLRHAMVDRALPFLVAAMSFLALLALAGTIGAAALARQWAHGAGGTVTVQVPQSDAPAVGAPPGATRVAAALALLRASPAVAQARALDQAELDALLRPWLGDGAAALALPLPAVIEVHLSPDHGTELPGPLADALTAVAPGVLAEGHAPWLDRLTRLAVSVQAMALLALALVVAVAVAVVAVATRAGLAARRQAVGIVHGLGATDGYIAARFARRTMILAGSGGLLGALAGVPLLILFARLAAPFAAPNQGGPPPPLIVALPALPVLAGAIGWITAQVTVRSWLRRLR